MFFVLLLIPILTIFSGLFMYRYVGEKRFLKLDLIQFLQAFIFLPVMLIWSKSFLYYILSNELALGLSNKSLIVFDTILTVLLFYIFAFIVLHSLTKTFSLRKEQDPLYDIFELSEYFHLHLSHLIIYSGAIVVGLFFSTINVFFPLEIVLSRVGFFSLLGLGILFGVLFFLTIMSYEVADAQFTKIMKLLSGGAVILHVLAYYLFDTSFNATYAAYWFLFAVYMTLSTALLFVERSKKATSFFTRLQRFFSKK